MAAAGFEQVGVEAVVQGVGSYVSNAQRVAQSTQDINRATQSAEGSSTSYGRSLTTLGNQMRAAGTQAVFLGGALAAPGIAALKVALTFDTAITRISTLSGVAQGDLAGLREGIDKISATSGRGPQELADALLLITSTGLRGGQALDVLDKAAKGAALGLGTAQDIGHLLVGTLKAYESQGLTAAHATDVLFATIRDGGAEADQFAGALARVTGIAAAFGVSIEEVGAFVAVFTRVGISADEAATALRGTLGAIFSPAKETAKALDEAGLSTKQLQDIVKNQGLVVALELLVKTFGDNSEAISAVIPNVRALAGVLSTAGSQADAYAQVLQNAKNSQGDFNKAFEQLQKTPGFAVQQAIADLQRALIDLGANGLPALVTFVTILSNLIQKFTELPGPVQTAILAISVIGGGLIAFGGAATVLIGTLTSLAGALTSVAGFLGLTSAAVLGGPVGLGLLAVAVVGAGLSYVFLHDKLQAANDEQQRSKDLAESAALAQKGSTAEIDNRVASLQASITIQQQSVDVLDAINNKTAEQTVREKELKDALRANQDELAGLAVASDILRTARDLGVKGTQDAIDATNGSIAANQHSIAVLQEANKTEGLTVKQRAENRAEIVNLQTQTDGYTSTLGRLKAALGIATDNQKANAAANKAGGAAIDGAASAALGASSAFINLGTDLDKAGQKMLGVSAKSIAAAAALALVKTNSNTFGTSFIFGAGDINAQIDAMLQGLGVQLGQARELQGAADRIEAAILHSFGELTPAEQSAAKAAESAAKSASSAAEKAANEAEQAAKDAEKALEDLAAKAKKVAEDASRNATKIAEDAAAAAVKAAEDAATAYAKIIQGEISSLDQLGGLLETALRRQAQQALDAVSKSVADQRKIQTDGSAATIKALENHRDTAIKAANDTRDATINSIETTRDAELKALQDQTDARVAALNAQLGILDQQSVAEQRAELHRNLALAFDPGDKAAAQKAITDFERQQQDKAIREQITAVQNSAKDQEKTIKDTSDIAIKAANDTRDARIQAAKDTADAEIATEKATLDSRLAALDAQLAAAQKTYNAITDEWALQSAARVLVMNGEIDKIGALLDAFVPEWRAAGLSFGEAIKNGLRASGVADFISTTLKGVPDASGATPAEQDRVAQIAGLEALGTKLRQGGAPQGAQDKVAQDIINLGGIPQFNNSSVQADSRAAEIAARQQQGKDLKAAGAPEITLEDLRQSLIALGAIPEFRRGLDMGMVRRPMLASLDPGEVVLNREQQGQMGGGATFAAGAFAGMFSGATFAGDANDNAKAIRAQLETFFQDIGRGAHLAGWR